MKKRLLPLMLALVMCLGLTVPALAEEKTFEETIPCQFLVAGPFREGLAYVQPDDDSLLGFMDKTGKVVIPCVYDGVRSFSEGLAGVSQNDKWGYIDKTGKQVIPYKYDAVLDFSEGLAAVMLNGKCGFIDKTGKEVIPCKYSNVGPFSEGLAKIEADGKWGFIDKAGDVIILCKYANVNDFSDGFAWVEQNNKRGFIDKTGTLIIPCKYDGTGNFSEGLAAVYQSGKWGFVDKTGDIVVPCKYDDCMDFFEGLALVQQNDKWGYIDQTGKLVVPCKYEDAWQFSEGFAPVMRHVDGKVAWGYIDKTGKEVVPCTGDEPGWYVDASAVSDGMARVAHLEKDKDSDDSYHDIYGYLAIRANVEVTASVSDWAKELVDSAAANGLIADGLGDDYRVNITRAQFAALTVKLYEAMSGETAPAAGDSPFSDTSNPAVIQAEALGFVGGVGGGKFAPDSPVTREQAATMLSRVYTKLGGEIPAMDATEFADNDDMSGYARDAIAFMSGKEIVGGVGNNKFDPQGNASIEQALVIALRMFEKLK